MTFQETQLNLHSQNSYSQTEGTSAIEINMQTVSKYVRTPQSTDNKYSRGVLGLITGSNSYPGAAVLSTKAAAYCNIGMVRYAGPLRAQNLVLQSLPEAVVSEKLQGKINALTIGSGISDSEHSYDEEIKSQRKYIEEILKKYESEENNIQSETQKSLPPVCVDAGALDLLPKNVCQKVILTPHAGELSYLFKRYDSCISSQQIISNPIYYAQKAADLTGATVLLKGAKTIVASPKNLNKPVYVAQYGPSWLATAGSGDVLSGIIGATLAQQEETIENYAIIAASAAVIHGISAMLAAYSSSENNYTQFVKELVKAKKPLMIEHPIVASDIIAALPHVFGILINMK